MVCFIYVMERDRSNVVVFNLMGDRIVYRLRGARGLILTVSARKGGVGFRLHLSFAI